MSTVSSQNSKHLYCSTGLTVVSCVFGRDALTIVDENALTAKLLWRKSILYNSCSVKTVSVLQTMNVALDHIGNCEENELL